MTITEAKKISIIEYLEQRGIKFAKLTPVDAWYLSPFREEKTPSLKVDIEKNLWFDHGIGEGGTIIDMIMRIENVDVSGALRLLSSPSSSFSFSPPPKTPKNEPAPYRLQIVAKGFLPPPPLLRYLLRDRSINIDVAMKYVEALKYKLLATDHMFFAIGFRNDKGGYEIRSQNFKGNIGGKAISTIHGTGTGNVAVFEGFIDFLSVMTKYRTTEIKDDVIVLNSLSLLPATYPVLKKYKEIKYFLDRDPAGAKATKKAISEIGGVDGSAMYRDYKDANEWLSYLVDHGYFVPEKSRNKGIRNTLDTRPEYANIYN